jgi:hypothetical protein
MATPEDRHFAVRPRRPPVYLARRVDAESAGFGTTTSCGVTL